MARRPNYGFEKRQKELDRQKKKEEKAERKKQRKLEGAAGEGQALEEGVPLGDPDGDDRGAA
jgi:hypothetical protein